MKKSTMLKRIMSFGLALALFVSSPVSVWAEEVDNASVETMSENTSEDNVSAGGESAGSTTTDSSATEKSESGNASSEASQTGSDGSASEDDSKNNEQVNNESTETPSPETVADDSTTTDETVVDDASETEEEGEDETEEDTDEEKKESKNKADTFHATVDGFEITADVPEGAFDSNDIKFEAETYELSDSEKKAVDEAVIEGENDKKVLDYYSFDLHFIVDGVETNPNDGYSINVSISLVNNIQNASVIHFDEQQNDVKEVSSTINNTNNESSEIVFDAESFSVYTVAATGSGNFLGYIYWGDNINVAVKAYDENGNAITTQSKFEAVTLDSTKSDTGNLSGNSDGTDKDYFKEIVPEIDGYTYSGTYDYNPSENNNALNIWNISSNTTGKSTNDNWWYVVNANTKSWQEFNTNSINNYYLEIYVIYSDEKDITYFEGNLFNYYKEDVNSQTMAIDGSENGALLFTTGGQSGKKWNDCDTDGLGSGTPTAFQGIVGDSLSNNMPTFNYVVADIFNPDSDLFSRGIGSSTDNTDDDTTVYTNVGIPFYEEDGYYVFDANTGSNKYTYNSETNNIEYSKSTTWTNGFWPFEYGDNHFGMSFQVYFNIDEDSNQVFEFTGDDDVWVFIDNKLVLDMGGVHQAVNGSINFSTGICTVDYAYNAARDINREEETHNLYTDSLGYSSKSVGKTALASGTHTLTFFYLERGAVASNCKIKFNFNKQNTPSTTDVSFKKVNEIGDILEGAEFALYASSDEECKGESLYTATSDSTSGNNVKFTDVKDGTYYLKETKAPVVGDGDDAIAYALSSQIYKVTVSNGSYTIVAVGDETNANVTTIVNKPISTKTVVDYSKSAKVNNWDNRTYDITLTADAQGITYIPKTTTVPAPVDVVLVVDATYSMYFPGDLETYARGTSRLDTSVTKDSGTRYYFEGKADSYTVWEVYYDNGWKYVDSSSENGLNKYGGPGNEKSLTESVYIYIGNDGSWVYTDSDCSTIASSINETSGQKYYFIIENELYIMNYSSYGWQYLEYSKYSSLKRKYPYARDKNIFNDNGKKYTSDFYYAYYDEDNREITQFFTSPSNGQVTRLSSLQTQLSEFVDTLAEMNSSNRIGIVYFNSGSGKLSDLTTLNDVGAASLKKIITGAKSESNSLASKIGSGTDQSLGLSAAISLIDETSTNSKFTLLISDGCPTATKSTVISSLQSSVNSLSTKGVTCLSLGLDVHTNSSKTSTADEVLKAAASNSNLYYTSTSAELYEQFTKITEEITNYTAVSAYKSGTIVDYIDERFELVGNASEYGGTAITDANGNVIGIKWDVDEIKNWSKTIVVKAKADFMGGNVITTNTSDSGVTVDNVFYQFKEPTVNVKLLDLSIDGGETTILKDDTFSPEEKVNMLLNALTSSDGNKIAKIIDNNVSAKTLLEGGQAISISYSYGSKTDYVGYIEVYLEKTNNAANAIEQDGVVTASVLGNDSYSYILHVSYIAAAYETRLRSVTGGNITTPNSDDISSGYYLKSPADTNVDNTNERSSTASYNVNVVDAGILIDKVGRLDSSTGLYGAKYKVSTKEDFSDSFRLVDTKGDDSTYKSMVIDGLGIGTYYIKEIEAPEGYSLSDEVFTITIANTGNASEYEMTITSSNGKSFTSAISKTFSVLADGVTDSGYFFNDVGKAIQSNSTSYLLNEAEDDYTVIVGTEATKIAFSAVDSVLYTLPKTGGSGVYVYTIGGILLMIAGALLLYKNKNNKNK